MITCRDCGDVVPPWNTWKSRGSHKNRCHPCYKLYTRLRQTPHLGGRKRSEEPIPEYGVRPSGRRWREIAAAVYAEETNCGICGGYVDQSLPYTHPQGRTVDHIEPIALGGHTTDRANLRLAHRSCNAKLASEVSRQRAAFVGAAVWLGMNLGSRSSTMVGR